MDLAEQEQSTLDTLIKNTEKEAEDSSGLTRYEDLLVRSPTGYKSLPLQSLNHLREQLPLYAALPKPPTLGEFNFLLGKKGNDLRELFEDNWKASTLSYAACAEVFTALAELTRDDSEEKHLSEEAKKLLTSAATKALLSANNSLARSREYYQYLAVKAANRDATKPGSNREKLIAESNAKEICQVLDTKSKLKRLTQPTRPRGRGRYQNRYWRSRGGRGRRNFPTYYNPRGRGQGRGRGNNTSSTSPQ